MPEKIPALERENHEESRFKKALAAAVVSLAVLSGTAATAAAPAHNDYRPCSEMRQPVPALPPVTVYVRSAGSGRASGFQGTTLRSASPVRQPL
jgi:hypothetical protein